MPGSPRAAATGVPRGAGKLAEAPDLEAEFMRKAGVSIEKGGCQRYLAGLEDIADDEHPDAKSELARVLRARCFRVELRPRQALNEYRKYLDEYPLGRYLGEAVEALGTR